VSNQFNGLMLAYLGDALYELKIRERLLTSGIGNVDMLHKSAVKYTSATAQAKAYHIIKEYLSEEEMTYFKRGRNAKSDRKAKSASRSEYITATGLESLFGWLYTENKFKRIDELIDLILRNL
jgi:ribonuclease-3 family protein